MRIVSLLPAATEMVCALELEDALVGRSHECDTPATITDRPVVSRAEIDDHPTSAEIDAAVRTFAQAGRPLYHLDEKLIRSLRPDLVVTQELCDVCAITPAQVDAALRGISPAPAVLRLGPGTLDDVFNDVIRLGQATDRVAQAQIHHDTLARRLDDLTVSDATAARPGVLFLEWLDPAFGAGHWNPELIERAGGRSVLEMQPNQHSQVIPDATLATVVPDLIFVAACGFDTARARHEWKALPFEHPVRAMHRRTGARLVFADGNAHFNRPGPRLIDSLAVRRSAVASCTHEKGSAT